MWVAVVLRMSQETDGSPLAGHGGKSTTALCWSTCQCQELRRHFTWQQLEHEAFFQRRRPLMVAWLRESGAVGNHGTSRQKVWTDLLAVPSLFSVRQRGTQGWAQLVAVLVARLQRSPPVCGWLRFAPRSAEAQKPETSTLFFCGSAIRSLRLLEFCEAPGARALSSRWRPGQRRVTT